MLKKVMFLIVIGGAIFVVGASLHDFAGIRELGNLLA